MEEEEDEDVAEEAEALDEQPSKRSKGIRKAPAQRKHPSGKI